MQSLFQIEAALRAPNVVFELRDYSFPTPYEAVQSEDEAILGFNLARPSYQGEGYYRVGDGPERYQGMGALLFMPAGIPFYARGGGGRQRVAAYLFSSQRFEALSGIHDWDAERIGACLDIRSHAIELAALRLVREAECPGFASDLLVEGTALSLMVELGRYLRCNMQRSAGPAPQLTQTKLNAIRDFIESAQGKQVRLSDLAQLCGMGVRTLTRSFRATTGQSIGQFAEALMFQRARHLLDTTDFPLKQIAFELGFSHAAAFSAAFQRITGTSPGQYRRRAC